MTYNCFTHCLKQASNSGTDTEKEINNNALQSMKQNATEHDVQFTRSALSNLLNPEDEPVVLQKVNRNDLVQEEACLSEFTAPDSDDKEEDKSKEVNSVEEELAALAVAKATMERHASTTSDILEAFTQCQRTLRLEKQRFMKQKTITDFFSKTLSFLVYRLMSA